MVQSNATIVSVATVSVSRLARRIRIVRSRVSCGSCLGVGVSCARRGPHVDYYKHPSLTVTISHTSHIAVVNCFRVVECNSVSPFRSRSLSGLWRSAASEYSRHTESPTM